MKELPRIFTMPDTMKKLIGTIMIVFSFACSASEAQELDQSVTTEERTAGGDLQKRYFVIRHRLAPAETPKEYGLLLILPGGAGGADFLPFCANVITALGTPRDFIAAELVAPVWGKPSDSTIVWPGKAFPVKQARFTSEDFIDSVIHDVGKRYPIRDGWVFTLGWSSSGHVLYSSSFENPKIRGSFIAMSRFQPLWFQHPQNAKGKRYYFWHSPDDALCPYAESEFAALFLGKLGASTLHRSYRGGHGWVPFTFYADRIKEALEWFRASGADASGMAMKIQGKNRGR
jgi:predicted esterase